MKTLNLLPLPRSIQWGAGSLELPWLVRLELDAAFPAEVADPVAERLYSAGRAIGLRMDRTRTPANPTACIRCLLNPGIKQPSEYYTLTIGPEGVQLICGDAGGLRAAAATLRQLLREHGRQLPRLGIRDWPDFPRRGFMLDVSRGRVPNLATLRDLADHLADFKINELQLYTEHI